ncbi:MAG: hypothetical protein M0Z30_01965 [Actinomycetota bacterium]|nr:hypothetical protein [Actinomycetota bacterium]
MKSLHRDPPGSANPHRSDLVRLEGLGGYLAQLASLWDHPSSREVICWATLAVESEPTLAGPSAHILLLGRSPPFASESIMIKVILIG